MMPYGDTDRIDWLERAGASVHVTTETVDGGCLAVVSWGGRSIAGQTLRQAIDKAAGLEQYEPSRWQGRRGRPSREGS